MKREHGMQPAEKDLGLVCHISPPLRDNGIEEFNSNNRFARRLARTFSRSTI
jgi:hypothetical protein